MFPVFSLFYDTSASSSCVSCCALNVIGTKQFQVWMDTSEKGTQNCSDYSLFFGTVKWG